MFSSFQKKLLHHRLLQGMLGRIIVNGRDGEDPNVDQATPWGRSRGLGSFFFYVYDFIIFFFYYFIFALIFFRASNLIN